MQTYPLNESSLIIATARRYLGAPWVHHQRSPYGCDCVGFLMAVGSEFGFDGSSVENYCRYPEGDSLIESMTQYLLRIPLEDQQVGDFLVFRIYKTPTHVGILSYDQYMIHADPNHGVVEVPFDSCWRRRLVAVFRFPFD